MFFKCFFSIFSHVSFQTNFWRNKTWTFFVHKIWIINNRYFSCFFFFYLSLPGSKHKLFIFWNYLQLRAEINENFDVILLSYVILLCYVMLIINKVGVKIYSTAIPLPFPYHSLPFRSSFTPSPSSFPLLPPPSSPSPFPSFLPLPFLLPFPPSPVSRKKQKNKQKIKKYWNVAHFGDFAWLFLRFSRFFCF